MRNLAGVKDCDIYIQQELETAGIEIVKGDYIPLYSEVPYLLYGKLGQFIFKRFWYYWVVNGDVPLEVAEEMYASPIGKQDVRVAGHCGCPPPIEWAKSRYKPNPDPERSWDSIEYKVVANYHIDSQEGLNLFVEALKKHNLIQEQPITAYYLEVKTAQNQPKYRIIETELEGRFLSEPLRYFENLAEKLHGRREDNTKHTINIIIDYQE